MTQSNLPFAETDTPQTQYRGHLAKMKTQLGELVEYTLPLDKLLVPLNDLIGRPVALHYTGRIHCEECGRKIKKTYNEGLCYPCTMALASADMCIVKPELCHYHLGTCREPAWGLANCMTTHYVYIANASGLKVGITRAVNIPFRWMDQGATQALPILRVRSRLQSGRLEVLFKDLIADKTDWRKMLSGIAIEADLQAERDRLLTGCADGIQAFAAEWGEGVIEFLPEAEVVNLTYPVRKYPKKIASFNLDKDPRAGGILEGIKGQYLIFDTGVINIRKYTSYEVDLQIG